MTRKRKILLTWSFIYLCIAMNTLLWFSVRDVQSRWTNVPPAPSEFSVSAFALGDQQFAYRLAGLMLQHLGDYGGRTTSLREYDFEDLTEWLYLSAKLDPISNHVPYIAAYYYSAVQDPNKLPPLIGYLRDMGLTYIPGAEKWRWLAQAVFLTRFKTKDLDTAYEYAQELAKLDQPGIPGWARQMPAFVKIDQGETQAAIALTEELIKTGVDKLHPNEVNNMIFVLCTRLLDEVAASRHPYCQQYPGKMENE